MTGKDFRLLHYGDPGCRLGGSIGAGVDHWRKYGGTDERFDAGNIRRLADQAQVSGNPQASAVRAADSEIVRAVVWAEDQVAGLEAIPVVFWRKLEQLRIGIKLSKIFGTQTGTNTTQARTRLLKGFADSRNCAGRCDLQQPTGVWRWADCGRGQPSKDNDDSRVQSQATNITSGSLFTIPRRTEAV